MLGRAGPGRDFQALAGLYSLTSGKAGQLTKSESYWCLNCEDFVSG